jgi:hypothetical protein
MHGSRTEPDRFKSISPGEKRERERDRERERERERGNIAEN